MIEGLLNGSKVNFDTWVANGGEWHLDAPYDRMVAAVRECSKLPLSITIGDGAVGICHTDPPRDWDDVEDIHNEPFMLWGRSVIKGERGHDDFISWFDITK